MIIYKITNTINGKVYIGQTTRTAAKRWAEHKYEAKKASTNCALHNAIRTHGADAFTVEVLFTCNSRKTLDIYEKGHIKFFHSRNKRKGYNLTDGGGGPENIQISEETRQKMRTRMVGNTYTKGLRRPFCKAGLHQMVGSNVAVYNGKRHCRACLNARCKAAYHKRR